MTNLDSVLKSRYITLLTKVHPYSQSYGFSNSDVRMWELDHKEGWAPKNWYYWIVVLEKTPESPLDCKEIKPVNTEGNQFWIFIGRTDVDAEALILRPPGAKSQLIGKKTLTLGKIEGISFLSFFLLYSTALTTVHDHLEDHSLDYMDFCHPSNVSAFQHTV